MTKFGFAGILDSLCIVPVIVAMSSLQFLCSGKLQNSFLAGIFHLGWFSPPFRGENAVFKFIRKGVEGAVRIEIECRRGLRVIGNVKRNFPLIFCVEFVLVVYIMMIFVFRFLALKHPF